MRLHGDGPSLEDDPPRRRHVIVLPRMDHPPKLGGMGGWVTILKGPPFCFVANGRYRTRKTGRGGGGGGGGWARPPPRTNRGRTPYRLA
ncbi:hypothetical protein Hanom_Chr09g00830491 [Helianthus anomalus]